MAVTFLRSRATCASCDSRLPPRTESWWDEETRTATCLSCARAEGLLQDPPLPTSPPAPAPAPEPAPAPAPAPEPDLTVPPLAVVEAEPPLVARVAPAVEPEPDPEPEAESEPTPSVRPITEPPLSSRPVSPIRGDRAPAASAGGGRRFSSQGANAIDTDEDEEEETDVEAVRPKDRSSGDDDHVQSAAELIGRLRSVPSVEVRADRKRDPLVVERPDPSYDRGPVNDTRVTQTLEAARIHGVEVLHERMFGNDDLLVDHVVIAVNGIWTIVEQETLVGSLEKRDLGDWFTADSRLFIGEHDRTDLVERGRREAEAVRDSLARTPFATVPVRPVVCFGTVPPGWVQAPFVVGGVSITWRNHLVEPMLDPVLLDRAARHHLLDILATHD